MAQQDVSPWSEVKGAYTEQVALDYALTMPKELKDPLYTTTLPALLSEVPPGSRVLDVGCGTGEVSFLVKEALKGEVVGIDLSPTMLAKAAHGCVGGEFFEANGVTLEGLPATHAAPEHYSLVLSFFLLHHMSKQHIATAAAQWLRVLKPGGHVIVAAWAGEGYMEFPGVRALLHSPEEVQAAFKAAGFAVQSCSTATHAALGMDYFVLHCTK
eukprot:TRINITY_DN3553_c0_g1_i1.p1 TRINITY_DN3553_c0_g1~~TRINITY_DN3553_c0_g1_i1.p1  ORF type:complete len:213 (+),score=70.96 TRINITY_DN3553_c0_g1_i1:88-726(+)